MSLQKPVLALQVAPHHVREVLPEPVLLDLIENHLQVGALLEEEELVHPEEGEVVLAGNLVLDGGGGGLAVLGEFVLDPPLDVADEFGAPAEEAGVVVVVAVATAALGETVHVELPDVGVHVAVLEVDRQDIRRKALHVLDDKTVLLLVPADRIAETAVLRQGETTSSIS